MKYIYTSHYSQKYEIKYDQLRKRQAEGNLIEYKFFRLFLN